jgi:hypothetical protein
MKEIKVVYREPNGASVEVTIPLSDLVFSKVGDAPLLKAAVAKNLNEPPFNEEELAEAERLFETLVESQKASRPELVFTSNSVPNPADVFTSAPVAPSTVGAEASVTAQEVTTATISPPIQKGVPSPPGPSSAPAQVAVAPPPSAPANGVSLDSKGLPWDARINAETRSMIADGSWKLKRGVDKALVEAVQAELRSLMAIPSPAATVAPPPPPQADVVPPPPPPVATNADVTFPELLVAITSLTSSGALLNEHVIAACNQVGVPNLPLLAQRPDLTAKVAELLGIKKS